jgi:hypothetical protein
MNIHKSNFSEIEIPDLFKTVVQHWHKKTDKMSDKQFLNEMKELGEAVREYCPECILINMSNFSYLVSPVMQKWVNRNIYYGMVKYKIKKVAYVRSKDEIAAICIDQNLSEDEALAMNTKVFEKEDDAKNWLACEN